MGLSAQPTIAFGIDVSQEHPELIFVTGPQDGQRVVLSRPSGVLGRGGGADILLSEEYASRHQARYELLRAGPVLESLSKRGTWINGKRYKSGKQVLLETGDVIGVGRTTQILFVAAGDDPDAALAVYHESVGAGKDAFGRKVRPEKAAAEPPVELPEPEPPYEETEPNAKPDRSSEMSAGERVEVGQKARRRKIIIGLGVYLGVFAVVLIILAIKFGGGKTGDSWPMPHIMTNEEITDALEAPVQRRPNSLRKEELEHAVSLYRQYGLDTHYLYECVYAFKEALAYSGRGLFDKPEHDRMYHEVLDRLTEVVIRKYRNACIQEKAKEWQRAEVEFFEILGIFPDRGSPLFKNVQDHYMRVKHFRQKKKPKKRRPWM